MGVKAAASQFNLGFINLSYEYYLLVCHAKTVKQEAFTRLIELISSDQFKNGVRQLPGYEPECCGDVVSVDKVFKAPSSK